MRGEDVTEDFWGVSTGSYLKIILKSGVPLKSKGWPWVQAALREVLGKEKAEKASFLRDGSLLIKTTNESQTDKLLRLSSLLREDCKVERDEKLNVSKGTIHAYDLQELSEGEIVQWLADFGVIGAKRFIRKVDGQVVQTPTVLLTFDMPTCPQKLVLDYVTYHVKKHVPNPLQCFRCGLFGHHQERCRNDRKCLTCGKGTHEGTCEARCLNCDQTGHSCRSRDCPAWTREKDICSLKVDSEISYAEARRRYDASHRPPPLQSFADVVRNPTTTDSVKQGTTDLHDKVEKLEKKIDQLSTMVEQLMRQLSSADKSQVADEVSQVGIFEIELERGGDGSQQHESVVDESARMRPKAMTTAGEPQQSEYRAVGDRKSKEKVSRNAVKTLSMDTDAVQDDPPSQVLARRSVSAERHKPHPTVKKSWK